MDDYLIRFAVTHDPNNGTGPVWPQYTKASPQRYEFPWFRGNPIVSLDTQRAAQMAWLKWLISPISLCSILSEKLSVLSLFRLLSFSVLLDDSVVSEEDRGCPPSPPNQCLQVGTA